MKNNIFLDSGAFSAFTKKVDIDINEYIDFIKKYEKHLTAYAVLDVIGSAKGTYKNQRIMERAGLKPVPCFHYGEDPKWLIKYVEKYDYIAIGGMVPISTVELKPWLDEMFSKYICDENGMPKTKVHGFGMTVTKLMIRYPWYSVDSTSWLATGRFGGILVPMPGKDGGYNYHKTPMKITFSTRPSSPDKFTYLNGITPELKKYVNKYIQSIDCPVGVSEFNGDEEIIVEPGLLNDYKVRDKANILFFLELEKSMPKYPWSFKLKRSRIGRLL